MIINVKIKRLFGSRLHQVMNELDVTDEQLANAVGVRKETVCRWRCGLNAPGVEVLIRIREELGVSIDWLLLGKDEKDAT